MHSKAFLSLVWLKIMKNVPAFYTLSLDYLVMIVVTKYNDRLPGNMITW